MKRLFLLLFMVFASCVSFAQLIETYPTSQRYLFNRYKNIGQPLTGFGNGSPETKNII